MDVDKQLALVSVAANHGLTNALREALEWALETGRIEAILAAIKDANQEVQVMGDRDTAILTQNTIVERLKLLKEDIKNGTAF
jgi:hypothetical protein